MGFCMNLRLCGLRWLCVFVLVVGQYGMGQSLLALPFELKWGDSPERLFQWAEKHGLDVEIHLPGKKPTERMVKVVAPSGALPGTEAKVVEGFFLMGKLYEVNVHYQDPEWTADAMKARFEDLKKKMTVDYGVLLPNQQQRVMEDQFVTRTYAYHKETVKGLMLMLAYTEVEDLLRHKSESRYSVIYRNDNYRHELMGLVNKK